MTSTVTVSVALQVHPDLQTVLDCLDTLATALKAHGHEWTPDEYAVCRRAIAVLERQMRTARAQTAQQMTQPAADTPVAMGG